MLLLRLFWRSFANHEYRKRWRERFGYVAKIDSQLPIIWLHAVSVGETLAAVPLIKALLQEYPQHHIVITSTTPTGSALVRQHFKATVTNVYLPFDLPGSALRFLKRIKPHLGIIMETELWPNLLHRCEQARIPMILANGRLSQQSMRGYKRMSALTATMLRSFAVVASQAEADGERFLQLGLTKERLKITGNIKFDIQLPKDIVAQGQVLRNSWSPSRLIFIAASTHAGEDEIILTAFAKLTTQCANLLLILVPRHPQRFNTVAQLCIQKGYSIARRSNQELVTEKTQILLVDTLGELILFYATADVAFVGGSFVPVGGHNLIEPAVLGVPVLTGPHLHNFVEVSQLLIDAGAAQIVSDTEELINTTGQLLQNAAQRQHMGQNGYKTILANRGALAMHLNCIAEQLATSVIGHSTY